jgi:hypothetical protein
MVNENNIIDKGKLNSNDKRLTETFFPLDNNTMM